VCARAASGAVSPNGSPAEGMKVVLADLNPAVEAVAAEIGRSTRAHTLAVVQIRFDDITALRNPSF
jgi:hypothetical protein